MREQEEHEGRRRREEEEHEDRRRRWEEEHQNNQRREEEFHLKRMEYYDVLITALKVFEFGVWKRENNTAYGIMSNLTLYW